jgi:GNAT superfamily N-acetyltransferase
MKDFETLSPARQLYVINRAKKKGISVEEFLGRKQPAPEPERKYPFSKIEDADFRLTLATQPSQEDCDLHNAYMKEYSLEDYIDVVEIQPTKPIGGFWKATIGSHTVGFFSEHRFTLVTSGKQERGIEHLYVKPEYRGWGVAERIYRKAIEMGFRSITLSWHRIETERQQQYWHSIGYRYLIPFPGQSALPGGLVNLRTDPSSSPFSYAYPEEFVIARKEVTEIHRRIVRRSGVGGYTRDEVFNHIDLVEDTTYKYLRSTGRFHKWMREKWPKIKENA